MLHEDTAGAHMYLQNAGLFCLCMLSEPQRLHKTLQHRRSHPSWSILRALPTTHHALHTIQH